MNSKMGVIYAAPFNHVCSFEWNVINNLEKRLVTENLDRILKV